MTGAGDSSRARPFLVYGAGLVQGLALVSFPAASSILLSPTGYDLSTTQYGLMFVPQVSWPSPAPRRPRCWPRAGRCSASCRPVSSSNLLAMLLLVLSQSVSTSPAAYPVLLCATGALGFGFGTDVPALNTFAARLDPIARIVDPDAERLLGTGTALAPLLIALFLALGAWWLLPVLAAVGLAGSWSWHLTDSRWTPVRGRSAPPGHGEAAVAFWWYAAAACCTGCAKRCSGTGQACTSPGSEGCRCRSHRFPWRRSGPASRSGESSSPR